MIQRLAFSDLADIAEPLSLALGVFDGVHRGHQEVLGRALACAAEGAGKSGVVTFEPHPVQVLAPERAPRRLLANLQHKERLLGDLGFDYLIVVAFDREFASQKAEVFAGALFCPPQLRTLAMGADWRFGKDRRGSTELLEAMAAPRGVRIDAVSAVMESGERISSTRIRQALRDGNLAAAEKMLGRPYSVIGSVSEGRKLGRTLGFPTANLVPDAEQLPSEGVWVVQGLLDGAWQPAVANLGRRPTVGEADELVLEVHFLDWSGDLYGKELEVRFRQRVRGEKKFAGLDELQTQIASDVETARAFFA